jgi:hypothetical protein
MSRPAGIDIDPDVATLSEPSPSGDGPPASYDGKHRHGSKHQWSAEATDGDPEEVLMKNGSEDLKQIFRAMGQQLGEAIGESMVAAVRAQLPGLRAELVAGGAGGTVRRSVSRGAKVSAALTRPCPVPNCTRPGRGPRFSFLCEVHRDMPAGEREKYRVRPRR